MVGAAFVIGFDHVDRVVFLDPVVEALGQNAELRAVGALDETTDAMPPRPGENTLSDSSLFTQPGSKCDLVGA